MSSLTEWQFGGWLQALPPQVAWGLLSVLGIAGATLILLSYRRTLQELPFWKRLTLAGLRVAVMLAILLCLANPSRVERNSKQQRPDRKLAVVVDRSESMNAIDNRSETRLGNAVRIWAPNEERAQQSFDRVEYYRFSSELEKAESLEHAVAASDPGEETHLFTALNQILDTAPSGIVCLTDGLDTSDQTADAVIARAQREGVPLYLVAGRNRTRMNRGGLLAIREIKTPRQALRQTEFTVSAVVEIAVPEDRTVPLELWRSEEKLASINLQARAGWNLLPWAVKVEAGEPGEIPLEFRLGDEANRDVASSTTKVVKTTAINILYYQGALQWGYRFLLSALQNDASFRMTSILNPALGIQMTTAFSGQSTMSDLPESVEDLKQFNIVILANVFADQLSLKQQQALIDFAKSGGGVLFIAPNREAAENFSGTPLEQMLPIVFEPPASQAQADPDVLQFQQHMESIGGSKSALETEFAHTMIQRQTYSSLLPFQASERSVWGKLFHLGEEPPKFSEYTPVRSAKMGAEVIAVHPKDHVLGTKTPRVLLARQQFGEGFTAALATDLLWKWKLSLPSKSRVVESFWQQFMLSLLPPLADRGLRIVKTTSPAMNQAVEFQLEGVSGGKAPEVMAVSPEGVRKPLNPLPTTDPSVWKANFSPDRVGRWAIQASDAAGSRAWITLPVSEQVRNRETVGLPPDMEGMRRIAEASGGSLIESGAMPFRAESRGGDPSLEIKQSQPLWNTGWLIALLLGVYSIELIARRYCRLL